MRVLPEELGAMLPSLKSMTLVELAEQLFRLGFETEILEGERPVLDVSITPDRGDAMSALGLARELAAWQAVNIRRSVRLPALQAPELVEQLPDGELPEIKLTDSVCAQYHAVVLENIQVGDSPAWLAEAVTRLGLRPKNNIVDLTNYLMEMYGQPLHAFDLDAILGGTMTVRRAARGERVVTLDGTEHVLPVGAAVIEDREALIDLAGIMGGQNSAVDTKTTRVLLQSALFDSRTVYRTMNEMGVRTDASVRYARGVDPLLSLSVLNEALRLLKKKEFGRAKPLERRLVRTESRQVDPIRCQPQRVNDLLGVRLSQAEQRRMYEALGCMVTERSKEWLVTPPSWRHDLVIWQDLAEEVVRLTGLDTNIRSKRLPKVRAEADAYSQLERGEGVKDRLAGLGFHEVMTYSFVSKNDLDAFGLANVGELANALNPSLKFLRPSLMPNLAAVLARNDLFDPALVFEVGRTFTTTDEEVRVGIGIAGGPDSADVWLRKIADAFGMDSRALTDAAEVRMLDDALRQRYKIRKRQATIIEFSLQALDDARRIPRRAHLPAAVPQYRPISKFPPVTRDIALVVSVATEPADIAQAIQAFHPSVESVQLFDEFVSPRLGEGKKSLAFHIFYANLDRTLTDTEVDAVHQELSAFLEQSFQATIR